MLNNISGKSLGSVKALGAYWKCVYAKSESSYRAALLELRQLHQEAADYIDSKCNYCVYFIIIAQVHLFDEIEIPHAEWATYAIGPAARWKQVTNNMSERAMGTMVDIRSMPATSIVKNYLTHVANTFAKRHVDDMANGNRKHVLPEYASVESFSVHIYIKTT